MPAAAVSIYTNTQSCMKPGIAYEHQCFIVPWNRFEEEIMVSCGARVTEGYISAMWMLLDSIHCHSGLVETPWPQNNSKTMLRSKIWTQSYCLKLQKVYRLAQISYSITLLYHLIIGLAWGKKPPVMWGSLGQASFRSTGWLWCYYSARILAEI